MAPSTRQQHNAIDMTSVATSTDTSTRSVSSKKKGKGTNTHPKLPPLVIRQPHNAGGESEVPFRKHALSPKEGPTTDAEGLAKRPVVPSLMPEAPKKPAKQVKVGSESWSRFNSEQDSLEGTHPPHLELSDNEVEPMSVGSVPPNSVRKLRRSETLVQDRDEDRNSSLDNNLSHSSATGSEGSDSEPVEGDSEEHEDMVAFTQTARSSQWLAVKRPSWLRGATKDAAKIVHSEPPTGKRVRFKGLDNQDSEYAGMASKGTDVHSKCPQDAISGLTGINVDTISEGQQATCMHSECRSKGQPLAQTHFQHHSEGQQMEPTHSKCCQVIATGLKGTASKGRQVILSYPTGYPQAASSEFAGATSKGRRGETTHSECTQATTLGFAATMPEDLTRNGHTGEVPQLWPMDTDLSKTSVKLRLTDQSSIVQSTIMGSFSLLHASIVLENAFPKTLQVARFIRDALVVASLQVWGAEDVHAHILKDSNYCWQMSVLPRARISIFHAEVKERCVVTVALLFSLYDPTAIADLVKKLETDFSYIYPRHSKANNDHVLVGSPDLRHPFHSSVIISVLCDLYFSGNTPFVTLHQDQFPCCHGPNEDIIWEVLKAMLALVSTAYYCHDRRNKLLLYGYDPLWRNIKTKIHPPWRSQLGTSGPTFDHTPLNEEETATYPHNS
ncbi:hypothetical protein EDB92DRAFT_1821052 [Lactarius akahatsu]|uniref:DUF6532 domain-containing protein n=1 Tax=Lactarius akahatsu TaxID=416441 RepID=A0AAD4Q7V4_9AGAM|nr:hypothetical protein EDB92DRAFT_1821052 [Lactarius akahatsu]